MSRLGLVFALSAALMTLVGCQSETARAFEKAVRELPAAEAEARRLGLVLDGSALKSNPPVAPEENAAPALRDAFNKSRAFGKAGDGWVDEIDKALKDPTGDTVGPARDVLAGLAPAMADGTRAAQRPRVDFGRDWDSTKPWDIRFPEYSSLKNLTKVFALRATLRARDGDTASALADFKTAQALARFGGADPVIIASLVRIACDSIVLNQMEWAATARPNDAAFHRALAELAENQSAPPLDFGWYLRSETLLSTGVIEAGLNEVADGTISVGEEQADPEDVAAKRRKVFPFGVSYETVRKAYRTRSLQMWCKVFSNQEAASDPRQFAAHLEQVVHEYTREDDPTLEMNRLLMPVFTQAGDAFVRHRALLGSFRALMAAVEFKHAKGRFPKTLSEAGFEEIDPYSGGPYGLSVEGGVVKVSTAEPAKEVAERADGRPRKIERFFPRTAD